MANPVANLPVTNTAMGGGMQALTIMPQTISEVVAFADRMADSRFVPAHLRGKPADCFAVALQAFRWQMDPFSVANKSYFVNDRMAYEAQLVNAVVYAHAPLAGRLDIKWEGAWPNRVCIVTGIIRGDKNPHVRRVDARTITVRNSPLWKSDPDQQLAYFATRAWARLYAPDVLMGVYTPEEFRGETVEGEVIPNTPEAERPESKLDAFEAVIAGEPNHAPTDATFGLPMEWPAPTADRAAWLTAARMARNEISALTSADALDNWMDLNADGVNQMMQGHREIYDQFYAKWDARKQEVAGE